jgi:hypothetical protein
MKRLLCLSVLACSLSAFSQSSYVVRPALGNPELTDGSGKAAVTSVGVGQLVRVTVPVYNNSFAQSVPAGAGRLEVDLGLEGSLEVVALPSGGAFSWDKPTVREGHSYISGRLVSALGGSYAGSESFTLKASVLTSTRLRMRWVDATPSTTKRSDVFAEVQVNVTNNNK